MRMKNPKYICSELRHSTLAFFAHILGIVEHNVKPKGTFPNNFHFILDQWVMG